MGLTKLWISFEDSDLEQIDGIKEQLGLPNRASAVRVAIRRWEQGKLDIKEAAPEIPGVKKGMGAEPAEEEGPAGWKRLRELAAETGGRYPDMARAAGKMKAAQVIGDEVWVSPKFIETVEEEKGRGPNWT